MQTRKGQSIEDASMEMIESEIGKHEYDKMEWPIVRRVIHSTADFDFAKKNAIVFHKNSIKSGMNALENGCDIVVDVNGVSGLFNKQNLKDFGNKIVCKISDQEVVRKAKEENLTRSQLSMRLSKDSMQGGVIVVGNAPTALLEVIKMLKEKIISPALIIGMPVGFISAAESKEELQKLDVPFISNIGRKGGSPSASAIINALYKLIRESSSP
ncbi:MAG: precorrin-8X methylmutase [Crenarchaeota archaeon]|nr:MAG: precorrin-8X methylmutase [Thermoproteota archaeon]RDJ33390.1 MAG: precorrin-8X methylmutase [Thermoproteota archaeon]RDJ36105.1 MAG: precorrin-8X methylmutase [Thermoproteota archaeon]RDJ38738.1 MAG: precorrin-8X methylmutase [Thermoproteota archaeon]